MTAIKRIDGGVLTFYRGEYEPAEPEDAEFARAVMDSGEVTVVSLRPKDRATFHLPGQHDQQSHGGDGGGEQKVNAIGKVFNSLPVVSSATGKGAAAWRKAHEETYRNDPEFKAVVDAVTLYTQGDYEIIRTYSEKAATGILDPKYLGSWYERAADQPLAGSPLSAFKSFLESQGDMQKGDGRATFSEAGRALNAAIDAAPPTDAPIYRGLDGKAAYDSIANLKPGDEFTIHGATSFSASYDVADRFARGIAGGGRDSGPRGLAYKTIVEVHPGAKALNVSMLSPWKQHEMLSRGTFRVVAAETKDFDRDGVARARLELKQVSK